MGQVHKGKEKENKNGKKERWKMKAFPQTSMMLSARSCFDALHYSILQRASEIKMKPNFLDISYSFLLSFIKPRDLHSHTSDEK